jgi:hypothetical protein
MIDPEIKPEACRSIHDAFAELAARMFVLHGVRVQDVRLRWSDTSSLSTFRSDVVSVEVESESMPQRRGLRQSGVPSAEVMP